jgi:hypothetical protein
MPVYMPSGAVTAATAHSPEPVLAPVLSTSKHVATTVTWLRALVRSVLEAFRAVGST